MFLICTYMDGERWESGLEPLLYPCGMSFYRPFSYAQDYFHPEQLANQLRDSGQRKSLLETTWNDGFFGVRFRDPAHPDFLSTFIPLRKVHMLAVDASDQINIAFRLGQFVRPIASGENKTAPFLPKMELTGVVPDVKSIRLFIGLRDIDKNTTSTWSLGDEFPVGMWEAFERTISPAAKAKILHTILLRFIRLKQRGKSDVVVSRQIDSLNHIWGLRLRENTAYDLTLSYFRIKEPGTAAPPVEHQFLLTNPREEVQASKRSIQFNANYRNEEMWICPKSAGPGPIQVSFEPCKVGDEKVVDPRSAKTIGIKIPVIIDKQKWPRTRLLNLLIGVISVLLIVWLSRKYFCVSEDMQKILLLVIAGLVSLAVNGLKDVVLRKE